MAKFRYPIVAGYCKDWTPREAIRELIANAIDGETALGAAFEVEFSAKKKSLSIINRGVKLKPDVLYIGNTMKEGDQRLIGQYGEGLKIALLVLARSDFRVKIANGDDETWEPEISEDGNGVHTLAINITKAKRTANDFVVELFGIGAESWQAISDMFLRLNPPQKIEKTSYGDVLYDPEHVGKIYAKGVYVCSYAGYACGYNFPDLEIGRDRRVPASTDLAWKIGSAYSEGIGRETIDDGTVLDLFMRGAGEAKAMSNGVPMSLRARLKTAFKKKYGDAQPVRTTSDADSLEHLGLKGIVVPTELFDVVRYEFQTIEEHKASFERKILKTYAIDDLHPDERAVFTRGLRVLQASGIDVGRLSIVDFQSESILGLHTTPSEPVQLARATLQSLGDFLVTAVHELAHDEGGDGNFGHVAASERAMTKVLNTLAKEMV